MAITLTDKVCETASGPAGTRNQIIHYDTEVKGFGLRVSRGGVRAFILNYRTHAGEERRLTIGGWKDPWYTREARKEAKRLKMIVDQGGDPQGDKHTLRTAPTVNDMIERWRSEHAPKLRETTRVDFERLIASAIVPELGRRRVSDVDINAVEAFHTKITKRGTPYRANRAVAILSKMFSLAMRWRWIERNPCRGVERNQEEKRERYLSEDELARLVAALADYPDRQAAAAIKLLLLTGARRGEGVLKSTWGQFDLEAGVWTKPSAHTKQDKVHRVPLSPEAIELLKSLPRTDLRLFPGLKKSNPLRDPWERITKAAGIEGLRLHDLRHSFASFLVSVGQPLPTIGFLLGHTNPITTNRYAHLSDAPQRAATGQVGAIVRKAGGNVVKFVRSDKPG